jgi:hypothetical protein
MRTSEGFAIIAALFCASCAVNEQPAVTHCTEPRPHVCTQEYYPVCGQLAMDEWQEYSSPCNACAHDAVIAYIPGACPAQP